LVDIHLDVGHAGIDGLGVKLMLTDEFAMGWICVLNTVRE
jgi:hypothetical protein